MTWQALERSTKVKNFGYIYILVTNPCDARDNKLNNYYK